MQGYTYSEARQELAAVLDKAETSGKVLIRRKDGRTYALVPERAKGSPLDVGSIQVKITTGELVSTIRAERGRTSKPARFLKAPQQSSSGAGASLTSAKSRKNFPHASGS